MKAFDDMVKAGGLISWSIEVRGAGARKAAAMIVSTSSGPSRYQPGADYVDAVQRERVSASGGKLVLLGLKAAKKSAFRAWYQCVMALQGAERAESAACCVRSNASLRSPAPSPWPCCPVATARRAPPFRRGSCIHGQMPTPSGTTSNGSRHRLCPTRLACATSGARIIAQWTRQSLENEIEPKAEFIDAGMPA